jgi:hypothetical protein
VVGIRRWLGQGLVLALTSAALGIPVAASVSAPASAAARTGTVVVTIKTPAGVPATVRLTSKGRAKVAKKPAAGTSTKVRLTVPVGRWRVTPRDTVTDTDVYEGTASRSSVRVRSGRTASLTVRYSKVATLGNVALTINTPDGVPGTVRLESGGETLVAGKAPEGTTETVHLDVPPGSWQVVAEDVVDDSALFTGTPDPAVLEVPDSGAVSASVDYAAAPSISDLHVVAIEPTRIELGWTEPSAGAGYVVRRAAGTTAPGSVGAGTPVPVDATTATDAAITPGETYAYSVFAQAAGSSAWVGPVSTVVTAPPTDLSGETAAAVTNPSTVMITDAAAVATTAAAGRVTSTVPAGRTPVVGQSWVLPPDTDIPTGYLGLVVAISPDGQSVELEPAALADAFDYLEVNVPSFASLPVQQVGPGGRAAARGVISCGGEVEGDLDVTRDLKPYGDIHATLTKKKILGKNFPVGAAFDGEFGVEATLEAMAAVEAGASCELDLPKIAIWFMAGPVPMVLTAQPTGSVGVSGEAVEKVGVTASLGAEFDGYFGLGGEDHIDGDLVTSIDPYADVTVAGQMYLSIGADIELGIGSGNPKAGALVGARGTFTALDAWASAVLGQNCLEVSASRSVSVQLTATAWLGKHDVSADLDVPFLNGSADWGGSPWTYPNTCAPAEYRIASGTVSVSSSWSGGCSNDGWCDDQDPETSRSETFSETSNASLRVADGGGEWVPRFASDPEVEDALFAPMIFNSWSYDVDHTGRWSGYGCSESWTNGTVGPVEFGGAYWESGVAVAPTADQGLRGELLDNYWYWDEEIPLGEWQDSWWWGSMGAWDTDWSNEYPRVPMRDTYSGSSACGWEPWQSDVYYTNLEYLGLAHAWWWPEQSRLASSDATVTPIGECVPESTCQWQVQGTDTYDYRSTVGGDECSCGVDGSGGATVTWSFVVESRVPPPDPEPAPAARPGVRQDANRPAA